MSAYARQRRRATVRRLRAEGRGVREIAREVGVSPQTVLRDLEAPEPARPLPAPPLENERALKAGDTSERRLAPLRQQFAGEVAKRWSWLDPIRRAIVADRLARLELARCWLDEQHALGLDRDGRGEPFPIVDRVEKWASRTEQIVADLEREGRERGRQPHSFDAVVAEIAAEDDQQEGDGP